MAKRSRTVCVTSDIRTFVFSQKKLQERTNGSVFWESRFWLFTRLYLLGWMHVLLPTSHESKKTWGKTYKNNTIKLPEHHQAACSRSSCPRIYHTGRNVFSNKQPTTTDLNHPSPACARSLTTSWSFSCTTCVTTTLLYPLFPSLVLLLAPMIRLLTSESSFSIRVSNRRVLDIHDTTQRADRGSQNYHDLGQLVCVGRRHQGGLPRDRPRAHRSLTLTWRNRYWLWLHVWAVAQPCTVVASTCTTNEWTDRKPITVGSRWTWYSCQRHHDGWYSC
jgi:hypothetical protein